MADQWSGGQSGPTDGWNVNLPAVVGVVFVFLVGVIAWVILAAGDDEALETGSSVDDTTPTSTIPPSPTLITSPLPMPSTSILAIPAPTDTTPLAVATTPAPTGAPAVPPVATAPPTVAPTTPPPTAAPATAAPSTTVTPPANGGDLAVRDHPMQRPPCEGGYITVLGSAIGAQASGESMEAVLEDYPGSNYLRTDQTCPSLTPAQGGQPIYVVFFGPFPTDAAACDACDDGPDDAYVRRLSNDLGPDHFVVCK